MKKLNYKEVESKFMHNLVNSKSHEKTEDYGNLILKTIVDSINKCIEEPEIDYTGKYIKFKEDCVFDTMQIPKDQLGMCIYDYGDKLDIHSCGYSHTVPKVSVYLCEKEKPPKSIGELVGLERVKKAKECLVNITAKTIFQSLANEHTALSVYWDEKENTATLENDKVMITIHSDEQ